ncbi:MAG: Flp pilus assembly complex ATPase component TadA [Lachnospiraceae bacterium]|nr:Flp pilus assembly complex ATPase component TadA [Lachnospiraceae bacterium]
MGLCRCYPNKDLICREGWCIKTCTELIELIQRVAEAFSYILKESPYEYGLSREQVEERIKVKRLLRRALKECSVGDLPSKVYLKDYIKDLLIREFGITEENIHVYLPFHNVLELTAQDKFEILLYLYQQDYGLDALSVLISDYQLDRQKVLEDGGAYYEISAEDIDEIYDNSRIITLNFTDKLNILVQRIYQQYKGNGVIDEIRDMHIDGVSGGASGVDSIWLFFKGKSIRLSFLSFGSEKELIRVCREIYRYNSPAQLSEQKGYIVNEMKDGSRVTVARPPFCESWSFFIRKFDTLLQQGLDRLITDEQGWIPTELMKWLVKGQRVIGVTGEQGAGKTTLLMALIRYIDPLYNLRIQEMAFELHLRKIYPTRNIVTFRETDTITGQEGLDFQKKTDGAVNILGEVATAPVCCWMIQMSQVASAFTMFTHHGKTTENLILAFRNALLKEGAFRDEGAAISQVVEAINIDIHLRKDKSGHRYIERINEIVPIDAKAGEKPYKISTLVAFEQGRYVWKEQLSDASVEEMLHFLSDEEKEQFMNYLLRWQIGIAQTENVKEG